MGDKERLEELRARRAAAMGSTSTSPPKKLSGSDRAVQRKMEDSISPASLAADREQDITPGNIDELERELKRPDVQGKEREILIQEHNRIKSTIPSDDRARLIELRAKRERLKNLKDTGVAPKEEPKKPQFPIRLSGESAPARTSGPMGIAYDPSSLGITPSENIAGHPVTRAVMGNPLIGLGRAAARAIPGLEGVNEHMKEYDKLEATGRKALGSEGFDWAKLAGSFGAPWGQFTRAGPVAGPVTQGAEGVVAGISSPGAQTTDEDVKGALVGGGVGATIPIVGRALAASGRSLDRVLPGGAERRVTRSQRAEIGDPHLQAVADALSNPVNLLNHPGGRPTAAQATAHLPEGSPVAAAEREVAGGQGGISARFGQVWADQAEARDSIINAATRSRSPRAFITAAKKIDRTGMSPSQSQAIDDAIQDAERAITANRPAQTTTLSGGAGGGLLPMPPGTPFSVRAINSIAGALASARSGGREATVRARRHLPDGLPEYAEAIRPRPPGELDQIVDEMLRRLQGPAISAGTQENR